MWKTTKQTKQCNVFPLVWAAIYGCKGEQLRDQGNEVRCGAGALGVLEA